MNGKILFSRKNAKRNLQDFQRIERLFGCVRVSDLQRLQRTPRTTAKSRILVLEKMKLIVQMNARDYVSRRQPGEDLPAPQASGKIKRRANSRARKAEK